MEQNTKNSNIDSDRIDDKAQQDVLLNCMADSPLRQILLSTTKQPKSILEISKENKIPLRTVYRKIQFLLSKKLIKPSGLIGDSGKKYFLFKSGIKSISAHLDSSNTILVTVNRNK